MEEALPGEEAMWDVVSITAATVTDPLTLGPALGNQLRECSLPVLPFLLRAMLGCIATEGIYGTSCVTIYGIAPITAQTSCI